MTREHRLLSTLSSGRRLCDDCLSDIAGVKPRQSVYHACSALRTKKLITRFTERCEACGRMKITNAQVTRATGPNSAASAPLSSPPSAPQETISQTLTDGKPWYWEGNVQTQIAQHLKEAKINVVSESNTATHAQGKDIEAIDADGSALWVTVKGFPENSPNTQARHWFAGALLDVSLYRGQNDKARLALGFPRGFTTYENLVNRTRGILHYLGCDVFWVSNDGSVVRESVLPQPPK